MEKLTGFIHNLLIGILACAIIFILIFTIDRLTRSSGRGSYSQSLFCSLNNELYEISILAEGKEEIYSLIRSSKFTTLNDNMSVTRVSVSPFIAIPELEKYDKFYQIKNVIFLYFEKNGGSCY